MAEPRVQRRLAAIVAADIVGYSRLMEADEDGTLARVKALRADLLEPKVAAYGGRIVKTTGDGTLIEFPSAVDAVQHAIEVQGETARRGMGVPDGQRIVLRMGINLGDIIVEGDDIYGDGVNIAARLEGLADPGGICISGTVLEHVRNKLDIAFDDLGSQALKNIAKPVHVYRVSLGRVERKPAPALALPDRPSIAVLPFTNMSGDPAQEYFVDGIVEDIITGLSRIKWLFVIARNSTFTYKGRAVDVKQIGRELGVRYVLEGSLRKAGNRVRIIGQLIDATTGAHVWAERYDRPIDDIFELQDEITMSVVGAIEPSLRRVEIERAKRKRVENLDAYDLYLRAYPYAHTGMPDDVDKALELLTEALSLQPDYAAALAAAAGCYEQRYVWRGRREADKVAALRHARAAIANGADDATALASAGFVISLLDLDYETALDAIDRALVLSNSSAHALGLGSIVLAWSGNSAQAIEYGERALRLSPFDPSIWIPHIGVSIAHFGAGRFDEAATAAGRAAQANPRFSIPCILQAAALSRAGRTDEAKVIARRLLELQPEFTVSDFVASRVARPENLAALAGALRQVGVPD